MLMIVLQGILHDLVKMKITLNLNIYYFPIET